MQNWMIVGLLIVSLVGHAAGIVDGFVRREQEQLSKLYESRQWELPYLTMTGDSAWYATTHIDNICRECEGVKDTGKIEFERPGRVRVLTCTCSRSFGDEGWRWVSGGSHR